MLKISFGNLKLCGEATWLLFVEMITQSITGLNSEAVYVACYEITLLFKGFLLMPVHLV